MQFWKELFLFWRNMFKKGNEVLIMLNHCDFYDPINLKQNINCPNCRRWEDNKCKDEELVLRDSKDSGSKTA